MVVALRACKGVARCAERSNRSFFGARRDALLALHAATIAPPRSYYVGAHAAHTPLARPCAKRARGKSGWASAFLFRFFLLPPSRRESGRAARFAGAPAARTPLSPLPSPRQAGGGPAHHPRDYVDVKKKLPPWRYHQDGNL